MNPKKSPLCWHDGPSVDGELARTLLLLEQRHLDTQAQMAVKASTTTRWKSPLGRVDMSRIGGNSGNAAADCPCSCPPGRCTV
ncbi:hypothetical protein F2Q68_00033974 [Brassica cretica]|uniref:Uncharacterized protein n=1 Tax=Brassica cretica TaxID=69181 RepID=A0A8S9H9D7_BRACR|nr:hypothetical protein F2Q68_00033974 [Brassica cretica]